MRRLRRRLVEVQRRLAGRPQALSIARLTFSFASPTFACALPAVLSTLPSASVLALPLSWPASSFSLPLTWSARPFNWSLFMVDVLSERDENRDRVRPQSARGKSRARAQRATTGRRR